MAFTSCSGFFKPFQDKTNVQYSKQKGKGLPLKLNREELARIRTDLDGFGDIEIAALVNSGYDIADRYIREYLSKSDYNNSNWIEPKKEPIPLNEINIEKPRLVNKTIEAGHSRFFRLLKLNAPVKLFYICLLLFCGTTNRFLDKYSNENYKNFFP